METTVKTKPQTNQHRPRIGHVLHRLDLAGAEVLAAALSRQLRSKYDFIFLCLDGIGVLGETLKHEGFPVIELNRRPGIDLRVAKNIYKCCKEHQIDLLHAHQYTPFFYSSFSRRRAFGVLPGNQPPVIFTEHGRHYPDLPSTKRQLLNPVLLRKTDRVTAVGKFIREQLHDVEQIDRKRIDVIYNGIDPSIFVDAANPVHRHNALQKLGISENRPTVMQVARFHPVKDHFTALHAFSHVAAKMPEALLVLVGDGDLRPEIENTIDELELANNVQLTGVRDDVRELLPAADVFLLSSLSEGISVTLLEAMACGLPIVATDVGGNAEVVEHGNTGLLSPRKDHQALAYSMLQLLKDPDRRRTYGQAGTKRLHQQFTQAQMHESYRHLYERILGR